MTPLLESLPLLACPIGMGLMMYFMMRGKGHQTNRDAVHDAELGNLHAEVTALRGGARLETPDAAPCGNDAARARP